jgi:hypothetical protein
MGARDDGIADGKRSGQIQDLPLEWMLLILQFDEFSSRLPEFRQFFSWTNLIWLWLRFNDAFRVV